jgi:hypothetical protein
MSYLIPLGYATITYSVVWLTGLGGVYDKEFVAGIIKRFGLGPLPAWAGITLYLVFAGTEWCEVVPPHSEKKLAGEDS